MAKDAGSLPSAGCWQMAKSLQPLPSVGRWQRAYSLCHLLADGKVCRYPSNGANPVKRLCHLPADGKGTGSLPSASRRQRSLCPLDFRQTVCHLLADGKAFAIRRPCLCHLPWQMAKCQIPVVDPMPTSFNYIACCLFTFPLLLSQKLQKHYLYFYCCYHHYHITLLLNYLAADTKFPGVVELTTQLLILESISS